MNSHLDVLIAFFFLGIFILIGLTVDSNMRAHTLVTSQEYVVQSNTRVLTDIIEHDFRKIGHGLVNPYGSIVLADTSHIIFSYDRHPRSTFDSVRVEYSLLQANATQNPNDKILLRRENGSTSQSPALGVTRFLLRFYNQQGTQLNSPVVADSLRKIRSIELTLNLKATEGFSNRYSASKYVTTFTPKNLLVKR
jgi:hypothetical protein